jgi:hypothetical protein
MRFEGLTGEPLVGGQLVCKKAPTRIKRQAFGLTDFAAFLVNVSSFFVAGFRRHQTCRSFKILTPCSMPERFAVPAWAFEADDCQRSVKTNH